MPPNVAARRVALQPSLPSATNIFLFLVAFRLLNALTLRTFFQPDEFFQSLEPAWQIAFGKDQGAWITWEWRHQLRSSLHPLLFAAVYKATDFLAAYLNLSAATCAELLVAAPKVAQAMVSAVGDFYTFKLATRIYGRGSRGSWTTLLVTVLNPWQWFCSTRTLSNCLETTITIVALELWPWQWAAGGSPPVDNRRHEKGTAEDRALLSNLRQCLLLAAFACILRPTNVLIWATLASIAWFRTTWEKRIILVREVLLCGSLVLAVSVGADRLFYGIWTFPPLRFLYFNIAQSLAVFYGRNDWHYYLSQGLPLLLTTALPFALFGLYQTFSNRNFSTADRVQTETRVQLAVVCLVMPFVLSLISHKEVRFIYPLLPALHIIAAQPLVQFFAPAIYFRSSAYTPRRLTLIFLVLVNAVIAFYTSVWHASGVLNVMTYLRNQHEIHVPREGNSFFSLDTPKNKITAGFLMPCHSTPWRSHLVYPTIEAWALSCEPPIDLTESEKAIYRDEADQFYDNPIEFLQDNMAGGLRHLPTRPSYDPSASLTPSDSKHQWPDYLIFFQQLENTLKPHLRGSFYRECWRTYNTAWHDDWRRHGDIVVWCLDTNEQDKWREIQATSSRSSGGPAININTNAYEIYIDRLIETLHLESHPKTGWSRITSWTRSAFSSTPWSSNQPSFGKKFASWRRAVVAYFAPRPSIIWRTRSSSPNVRDWIPFWDDVVQCHFLNWRWWVFGESLEQARQRELYE